MFLVPWWYFFSSPLKDSKPKQEYAHNGPQFFTWYVRCRNRCTFIRFDSPPNNTMLLWSIFEYKVCVLVTHHTDLTFFYKMFQVEHWLSLNSHLWCVLPATFQLRPQSMNSAGSKDLAGYHGALEVSTTEAILEIQYLKYVKWKGVVHTAQN